MHDRIAKIKIAQGYIIGFVLGFITALVLQANAHTPCNDDIQCGYRIVINMETGEEIEAYICD